ncbi:MAG: hypothetical protein AAF388_09490 [Bacteroidota bacterium]
MFTSCELVSNAITYKNTAKDFLKTLLREDYDGSFEFFAIEHEVAKNTNLDDFKAALPELRELIVGNFGEEIEYTFMTAQKRFSTNEEESTPPNTTVVLIQIENQEEFGVVKLLFDDSSKKILNVDILDIREKVPNMLPFWLFGVLALCVPAFNIIVINRVRKSNLPKKWLKYLAIIFFNVPTITYSAIGGLSFKLISFQFLLGISSSYMGFMNAAWTFGIPLGGMYWLWKLSNSDDE